MAYEAMLEVAKQLAKAAGQAILPLYHSGDFTAYAKSDESPVTSADLKANEVIVAGLQRAYPEIPILSEETQAETLATRLQWQKYWLIDPIDGTGEFIAKSGDFAVNIALVEQHQPVIGVIYWPVHDILYFACKDYGAFKQSGECVAPIHVSQNGEHSHIRVAVSRRQKLSTVTDFFNEPEQLEFVALGSCSLKSCFVAEGKADCYLRVGPTGEWDTGASQVIVQQAGGCIVDSQFKPLTYNLRETLANPNFMVLGTPSIKWTKHIKCY